MKISLDNKEIGQRIQDARKKLNLTQEEFAERCDLSLSSIRSIENGNRGFSIASLCSFCKTLNISADYILSGKRNFATTEYLNALSPSEKNVIDTLLVSIERDMNEGR